MRVGTGLRLLSLEYARRTTVVPPTGSTSCAVPRGRRGPRDSTASAAPLQRQGVVSAAMRRCGGVMKLYARRAGPRPPRFRGQPWQRGARRRSASRKTPDQRRQREVKRTCEPAADGPAGRGRWVRQGAPCARPSRPWRGYQVAVRVPLAGARQQHWSRANASPRSRQVELLSRYRREGGEGSQGRASRRHRGRRIGPTRCSQESRSRTWVLVVDEEHRLGSHKGARQQSRPSTCGDHARDSAHAYRRGQRAAVVIETEPSRCPSTRGRRSVVRIRMRSSASWRGAARCFRPQSRGRCPPCGFVQELCRRRVIMAHER